MLLVTGTLTEQGLELQGVLPITNAAFQPMTKAMEQLPLTLPVLLASCHGLAQMGEVLVGDPLDQKLFAASGWSLHDGDVHAADGHVDGAANGTAAVVVNPLLQQVGVVVGVRCKQNKGQSTDKLLPSAMSCFTSCGALLHTTWVVLIMQKWCLIELMYFWHT